MAATQIQVLGTSPSKRKAAGVTGVNYDPNMDYAAEIQKALTADPNADVSSLQAQRSAKIAAASDSQLSSWGVDRNSASAGAGITTGTNTGSTVTPTGAKDITAQELYELIKNQGTSQTANLASQYKDQQKYLADALKQQTSTLTQQSDAAKQAQLASLKAEIAKSISGYQTNIDNTPGQYQPLKNESEVQRNTDLRSVLEQAANAGDRGGIGRQQALLTQTEADNRLNDIGLQLQQYINQQKTAIDDVNTTGASRQTAIEQQAQADLLSALAGLQSNNSNALYTALQNYGNNLNSANSNTASSLINALINQQGRQDTLNQNSISNAMQSAQLTGSYNPYAQYEITPEIQAQLAPYMDNLQAFINANPDSPLKNYAENARYQKVTSDSTLNSQYGNQYMTAAERETQWKQSDKNPAVKAQLLENQIAELKLKNLPEELRIGLEQEETKLAAAKIQLQYAPQLAEAELNNIKANIAQSYASAAAASSNAQLARDKYNDDKDLNSLDNRYKQAQLNKLEKGDSTDVSKIIDDIDNLYTYKNAETNQMNVKPGSEQQLRNYIISLGLSDAYTDQLLLRYGLPTN